MNRRNTIQKELVLNAVMKMRRHVTAEEVYDYIKIDYPTIGKGTVYRNLGILADEKKIRRVEIPGGADCFDFTLEKHYHVRCIECGKVFDVDMDETKTIYSFIHDRHGMKFLDYDIVFKGICKDCQDKGEE
ncbi:MAG: transcriptional repressor [Acetatifactor sp.]|nr:transcriptional repressor [Acetatifactor sp.]